MAKFYFLFFTLLYSINGIGQSLIANIPFDNGSTEVLGTSIVGSVVNASPSKDRLGKTDSSFSFNGSDSYINFGSNPVFELRDGYSISAWFNYTGDRVSSDIISNDGGSTTGDYSIVLSKAADGSANIILIMENSVYRFDDAVVVPVGWNHVALTIKDEAEGIKIYLNGDLAGRATPNSNLTADPSNDFYVGVGAEFLNKHFEGGIDDIKIYDGVISSDLVAELASPKPERFSSSKIAFGNALRFDGLDDYAILPSSATDGLTDFTFETWINWRGGNDNQVIWSYGAAGNEFVLLQIVNSFPTIKIGFPGDFEVLTSSQEVKENIWQHLAIKFDDASANAYIYLDGIEVANAVLTKSPSDIGSLYQTLGLDRVLFTEARLNASLDETRLWSTVRTEAAIEKYKNIAIDQFTPDLVYKYNYDESIAFGDNTANEVIEDLYSNYDGTPIGFQFIDSVSNYVSSSAGTGTVQINRVSKEFAQAGQSIAINGTGFISSEKANHVFLGGEEVPIISVNSNRIKIQIPEEFNQLGALPLRVVNENGPSHPKLLTLLYQDENYEYKLAPDVISGNIINSLDVLSGDIDGDGDVDVLQGYIRISWLENTGNNNFVERGLIKDNCECQDMKLFDFDNDGDLDVVLAQGTAGGRKVSWIENLSQGTFSNTPQDITTGAINLREIEIIDSNQDGFNDVLVSSNEGLHVYLNDGSNSIFSKTVIKVGTALLGTGVAVLDLENDGDLDIFASMYDGAESRYYLFSQDQAGDYIEEYSIPESTFGEPIKFVVSDFNSDGYDDIVSLNFASSYLFLNNQGDKTFTPSTLKGSLWSASATDIEGDGDMDLITGVRFGNEVGLYLNAGTGVLTYSVIDNSLYGGIINIDAADFDGDGDADFITDKSQEGLIKIYEHINIGNDIDSLAVEEQVSVFNRSTTSRRIDIVVPHEYDLENVAPTFQTTFKSKAYVEGVLQESGSSIINFSDTVTYEIIGDDGKSAFWRVTLNPLPGIPELTEIDDFTQTAAEIEWSIPDYTESVALQLSTDDFETLVLDTVLFGEEIVVDFLEAGTEYAARVKGLSEFGESEEFSEDVVFLTIPPNPVLNQPTEVTSTTAVINWEENKATDNYILDIARDSTFTEFANGFDNRSLNTLSETVFGLTPGTKYWVRLSATNNETIEDGTSGFSDVRTFTTALDTAPLAKDASAITVSSFTANWDLVDGQNINYVIEVADDIDFSNIVKTSEVNAVSSIEISELKSGISHWYRVYATNVNGRSPNSNIIFVGQPLRLSELSYPSQKSQSDTTAIHLSFTVRGGQDPYDVIFRYRGILTTEWQQDSIDLTEETYRYTIQNEQFDDVGIEFEILASDGVNTVRRTNNFIYLNDAESELPGLDLVNEWQIFSIPYELEDNLIETVFDEMGPFEYDSQWRLVRFDGENYLDAGSGINRIELGASYWFNSTEEVTIEIENGTVNTADSYTLDLNEGWNQIGNPYNVPISWNSVRFSNRVAASVEQVNLYNLQSKQFVEGDIIEAFSGGFVWSDNAQQVEISLRNDNAASRTMLLDADLTSDVDADNWLFELAIISDQEDTLSNAVGFGIHPEAKNGKDQYDKMQLPRFMAYTEMHTLHQDYFHPYFSRDIKASKNSDSWLYHLSSNEAKGQIRLKWDNQLLQSGMRQLWLIDEENGRLINMADQNSITIQLKDSYKISLHYTESRNVKPLPFKVQLGNPYPNPTSGLGNISVSLPDAESKYQIKLALYDVKGRKVKTLAQGEYAPGIYDFQTDLNGLTLESSAVFFYRLSVKGQSMVKRILIK